MNDCTGESKRVQYKLVPVEPTEEMVSAGLSARTCPRERYQAMLAASPDFGSKVAAEVNQDEYGFCADILLGQRVRFGKPLYAHLQPAINVTQVVEALQLLLDMEDEECRYDHQGYCQNHNLDHIDVGCRVQKARTALVTYHSWVSGEASIKQADSF